jgi:hypothetical protein
MSPTNTPQIEGPEAHKIEIEPIPDATGFSGEDAPAEKQAENKQDVPDPTFPFGRPEHINWEEIDPAGHELLKEINLRQWMKTTEYCSGHPLDRPLNEASELYPYITGENVYEEIHRLDLAYMRGLVNDSFFKHRKLELRNAGCTRFYLNVNVYDLEIFLQWTRFISTLVIASMNSSVYPLVVRFNPLRPGNNVSLYWDYWTMDEREMIHGLLMASLAQFPV